MGFVSRVATSPLRFDCCQVAILKIMRKKTKKVKLLLMLPSVRLFLIALSALFREERLLVTWSLLSFVGFYLSFVHGNEILIRLEKTNAQLAAAKKQIDDLRDENQAPRAESEKSWSDRASKYLWT